MLVYPTIDRIILHLGPIRVSWYGLIYALSFLLVWKLAAWRARKLNYSWQPTVIEDYIFCCALGVIIGGRLGYVLLYDIAALWHDPLLLFKIWQGGMSFHGGMLGVLIGLLVFASKYKIPYLAICDFSAPLVPIGLALGRVGNFINGELWGRVTTLPWGMVFPYAGTLPRHPSQLYEALTEGGLLYIILWLYTRTPKPRGTTGGLFLVCYGVLRFSCEFLREPDQHLGFIVSGWMTMGQILSMPMIIAGIWMLWVCSKNEYFGSPNKCR